MPKVVPTHELDAVLAAAGKDQTGASIEDLARSLEGKLPRRTLQRRVASLVASGKLARVGRGPAVRYRVGTRIVEARAEGRGTSIVTFRGEAILTPASPEGREFEAMVRRPLHERAPIGYRRELLDNYMPNVNTYLSASVREKLHAQGRPRSAGRPAGTYARDILGRLLIDRSWASSSLEGNTYTRLDTQNLIEFGQRAAGKDQREAQMILNHKAAIEMLVENAEDIGFNRHTFQNLHALLSENLLTDGTASGRLRTIPVDISGSVFVPLAIPHQIAENFDRLLAKADAITDPYEQAFFVMAQLPYLQPFEDVNKRVSRLGANISLIKHNLSPLSFVDVPERAYVGGTLAVYELNRVELLRDVFVWAYDRSCLRYVAVKESLPEPDPLRIRNRQALIDVVSDVVRAGDEIDLSDLRERAGRLVLPADLKQFAAMAFNDLHHLHEGNLARYRLRLSEFTRWRHGRTS